MPWDHCPHSRVPGNFCSPAEAWVSSELPRGQGTLAPRGPGIWEWTVSPRPARPRGRVCCVLGPGALQSLVGLAERLGGGDRGDQSTSLFGTSSPPGHTARETVSGRVLGLPVTEPAADCTQIKQRVERLLRVTWLVSSTTQPSIQTSGPVFLTTLKWSKIL